MGEGPAEGIDPRLPHVGGDARQLGRAHVDAGKLLPGQIVGDRDRYEPGAVHQVAEHLLALLIIDRQQLGDQVQGGVGVRDLVLGDQQPEIRPVAGQLDTVAVHDAPARRRGQAEVELVGGREVLVTAALEQLQLHQPTDEGQKAHPRQPADQEGAPVELALPLVHLLEEDGRFVQVHRKRTSASSNRSISRWAKGNSRVVGRNCQNAAMRLGGLPESRMVTT